MQQICFVFSVSSRHYLLRKASYLHVVFLFSLEMFESLKGFTSHVLNSTSAPLGALMGHTRRLCCMCVCVCAYLGVCVCLSVCLCLCV